MGKCPERASEELRKVCDMPYVSLLQSLTYQSVYWNAAAWSFDKIPEAWPQPEPDHPSSPVEAACRECVRTNACVQGRRGRRGSSEEGGVSPSCQSA